MNHLNYDQNSIILTKTNLSNSQISQLAFWGFRSNSKGNFIFDDGTRVEEIFKKLHQFFIEEGISFNLSQSAKILLKNQENIFEHFNHLKIKAQEFKDSKNDEAEFNNFVLKISKLVSRPLKDHQLKAAFHLYSIRNGANFSVPGSGKTAAVLAVYELLRSNLEVNNLFVIGPPACFAPWRKEYELTLGRKPKYIILAGGDYQERKLSYYDVSTDRPEVYLTTFQSMLNDQDDIIKFLSMADINAFVVIDEAHYIKRVGGSWARAALNISNHAYQRCVLTGTPLPKSYTDIFNLYDFLWPTIKPISNDTKVRIQIEEEDGKKDTVEGIMDDTISPLFYRVRKQELGLIPPIFHPPTILDMNEYEHQIYDAIFHKISQFSKDDYLKNIDIVRRLQRGRITRLRQAVSYTRLLSSALIDYQEHVIEENGKISEIIDQYDSIETPAKLEYLSKFLSKMKKSNLKVVVWSNFIGTIKLITNYFSSMDFYCKMIIGEIPTEQISYREEETREKIRNEFIDPDSGLNILIANPAACGESISLHKTCYHSVYYDLSYNCAQYLQSLDRIHRVGGSEENQANYHYLQYRSTIDQDIMENLNKKAQKMYDLIEKDYSVYSLDMFESDDDEETFERLMNAK